MPFSEQGQFEINEAATRDAATIGLIWASAGFVPSQAHGMALLQSIIEQPGATVWTVRIGFPGRHENKFRIVACALSVLAGELGYIDLLATDRMPAGEQTRAIEAVVSACEAWLQTQGAHRAYCIAGEGQQNLSFALDRRGFGLVDKYRRWKWLRRPPSAPAGLDTVSDVLTSGPQGLDEARAAPLVFGDDGRLEVTVTFLQMTKPPDRSTRSSPHGLEIVHAQRPTVSFYRYLYNTVGQPWLWWERRIMDENSLAELITDPNVQILVPMLDGVPAGLIEIDNRRSDEAYLAYFGLMPQFIGRGLGVFALEWAIEQAWRRQIRCMLVNTCTFDHRSALPLYLKCGFQIYRRETTRIPDPRVDPRYQWPL